VRRHFRFRAISARVSHDAIKMMLYGSFNDAIALQKPPPNELLWIVAKGEKSDRALAV
jgi:hypothetical protein